MTTDPLIAVMGRPVRKAAGKAKASVLTRRGKGRKPPSSREAIMHAAAEIYTRYGYEATTIRDIAATQRILPGSIYHYFGSKDALILELHKHGIEEYIAAVTKATDGIKDPWTRLDAACAAHLDMIANGSPQARLLNKDIPMTSPKLRKALIALRDRYEQFFQSYVDALNFPSQRDAHLFRLQVLGSLNATTRWYRKEGKWTPKEIAQVFMSNLKRP